MIRNDFVSNSSSSSFMIVGYCSNYDEIIENLESRGIDRGDEESLHCLCELLINKTHAELGHEQEITDDPYNCWFGLGYADMEDDETKKEFKERIFKEVKKIFPNATIEDICYECQGGRLG